MSDNKRVDSCPVQHGRKSFLAGARRIPFRFVVMRLLYMISVILLGAMHTSSLFAEQSTFQQIGIDHKGSPPANSEHSSMKVRLIVNNRPLSATLVDSPTTRDFVTLLPLTVTLEDYANNEKIAYLSRKLTEKDAPEGMDPSEGDITYYAPWGNLALFYRDFVYAKGLIKLGSLDEGTELFKTSGSLTVTIEPW